MLRWFHHNLRARRAPPEYRRTPKHGRSLTEVNSRLVADAAGFARPWSNGFA
jgi:hypothetical protein